MITGLPVVPPIGASERVSDYFYRAFEDKFRGSRDLIKERLRVYLPFVTPLTASCPAVPVLDLGCGRGEWLELMHELHIPAHGIDTDAGMLAACRERGFSVSQGDAIAHLQRQPDQSVLVVTGFHIAEHLPFAALQDLMAQACRVLVPGGLLILETPNPENLLVGAAHFYLDPTHQRPLPWQLLTFLAEQQGFGPVKLLRLQEEAQLASAGQLSLYDVLAKVSPDYAIIAQMPAAAPPPAALALALARDHGLSLHTLAARYDQQRQLAAVAQLQAIEAAHHTAQQALAAEIKAVYASQSWRITRPLRWLMRRLRGGGPASL